MANITTTCRCSHAGLHHRGSTSHPTRCRIPGCACLEFAAKPLARRKPDLSWLKSATHDATGHRRHHGQRRKGDA